ncbi:MAG TPA: amidohydrolase family protein, partial [Candidatus Methanoperedenaceae archaeon]|nr:amidohydrolase family protein [Candidatus Methanoperedenaceae archaeon]
DDRQVFNLCTLNGANVLGLDAGCIEEGREAAMMVLDSMSDNLSSTGNPLGSLVRRARPDDIIAVMRKGVVSCKAK